MENIEITFSNVRKEYIDLIIYKELELTPSKAISSHFYDELYKRDMEFLDIISLKEYYSTPSTGNIYAKEVFIGDKITNVMLVMSFDGKIGDIVLNFKEEEFISLGEDIKQKLKKILIKLVEIRDKYEIEEIRIGYEPASDDDMLLLLISKEGLKAKNEFNCMLSDLIKSL